MNSLADKLTNHIANQFDKISKKFRLTYDDFPAFALGYTLGIFNMIKREK